MRRRRPARVGDGWHMTWSAGDAVGHRPVWWWWPLDWYRMLVDIPARRRF